MSTQKFEVIYLMLGAKAISVYEFGGIRKNSAEWMTDNWSVDVIASTDNEKGCWQKEIVITGNATTYDVRLKSATSLMLFKRAIKVAEAIADIWDPSQDVEEIEVERYEIRSLETQD